jgi:ankyrin repeat protein
MQDEIKTFLMFCETNDAAMVELELRSNPALVNAKNEHGTPALHLAVEWASLETIDVLLKYDVDVAATDEHGATAVDTAMRLNYTLIAEQLNERRAEKELYARTVGFRKDFEEAISGFQKGTPAMSVPKHNYKWKR